MDADALFNFDQVPAFIRDHLKRVYLLLACGFASSTSGYLLNLCGIIRGWPATLGYFLNIVGFCFVDPLREKERVYLFIVGAFFKGAFVGPYLSWFLGIDPWLLVSALVGISLGFGCFWASSRLKQDLRFIYLSGMTQSCLLVLAWMAVASTVFGGAIVVWRFEVCAAIVWFMVYVTLYSQVLVVKTRRGEQDYVNHAITLFTKMPVVFFNVYLALWTIIRRWIG